MREAVVVCEEREDRMIRLIMHRADNFFVPQRHPFLLLKMVASANDITIHRLLIQCEQQLNNVNDWSDGDKSKYALVSHWTLALAPHLCLSCVSFYLSSTFDTCNNPTAGTFELIHNRCYYHAHSVYIVHDMQTVSRNLQIA